MLELHRSFAKSFPFFELTRVDIAMLDVLHPALTIRLVGCPFTIIAIAIGIIHGTSAAFPAGDKIAVVEIAGWSNQDTITVGPAAFEGMGSVTPAKIGAVRFVAEV